MKRHIKAEPEGMRLLAIGSVPGGVYQPLPYTELGGPEELGEGIVS